MNVFRCLILSLALVFAVLAAVPVSAKTLTIGLDASGSSPLSVPDFAQLAAGRVQAKIAALKPGDFVSVRTIGDRGFANLRFRKIRIDKHNTARDVAGQIGNFIRNRPSKPMESQRSTNLLAFLMYGRDFGCEAGGEIWLITDGLESSEFVKTRDLISGKPLPAPPKLGYLAGCSLTMDGFGGNIPVAAINKAQAAWEAYSVLAGIFAFDPIRL